MSKGDASYIKQMNRRILIEHILKEKSLSRSDLSRRTGLNKATVSVQINELIQEEIVVEQKVGESVTLGRKPILLEMNDQAGYSIGIDIDDTVIRGVFLDFKGNPFHHICLPITNNNFETIINEIEIHLLPLINKFNKKHKPRGLIGVCVGIHGIINNDSQIIFTPKHHWSNVHAKERLEETFHTPVFIDNNANLSAYGEHVYFENISDLFCITLFSGIGLGIINNFSIYRGFQGFAGEVGHMIIDPNGPTCACGNHGCWELYASEKELLHKLSNHFPEKIHNSSPAELLEHPSFAEPFDHYLSSLSYGLNNIINIFNPQRIVLNGALINKNPNVVEEIKNKLHSKINNYEEIRISQLGESACAMGGAAFVLKDYFNLQTLDFLSYEYFTSD
ncbi:ROK family transcriptional regulator [Halobacillus salinarum]|uniref:ROK family transcriptional regulator n=1 Tax=Halobacillus salinarum TaxID=2932257 RepID=A0ABY4EIB4_9BACI|nr:ROK family transcriptional regulator [Halobacillus salinarum]UOQ44228.1 ROK family transcriptional regulator [Halobacillus salinarum]